MNRQILDLSFYQELTFEDFAAIIWPYIPPCRPQPNPTRFVEFSVGDMKVQLKPKDLEKVSEKEFMNSQMRLDDLVALHSPKQYSVWFLENEDTYKSVSLVYRLLTLDDVVRLSKKKENEVEECMRSKYFRVSTWWCTWRRRT